MHHSTGITAGPGGCAKPCETCAGRLMRLWERVLEASKRRLHRLAWTCGGVFCCAYFRNQGKAELHNLYAPFSKVSMIVPVESHDSAASSTPYSHQRSFAPFGQFIFFVVAHGKAKVLLSLHESFRQSKNCRVDV